MSRSITVKGTGSATAKSDLVILKITPADIVVKDTATFVWVIE